MKKQITFNKQKLREGINKSTKEVISTLGQAGRLIVFENEYGQVLNTKDGVTVLKNIELEDPIENMGVNLLKQAANKVVKEAGDGTTTTTLLTNELVNNGLDLIQPSTNVNELKKGIELATKFIIDELKNLSKDVTETQLKQVATISANNDEVIGNLVATAIEKAGRDGTVVVEESRNGETSLEIVEGIQFDRGWKSPYFVTDNNTMSAILNDPYILIYDKQITQIEKILPILEKISTENKPLLIIADDIEGRALATLIVNKGNGLLKVAAVKAPGFGDKKIQLLEDIATLTGGQLISESKGMNLEEFDLNWLGKARTITVGKEITTIVDGKGSEESIKQRAIELKNQIDNTKSSYEIEQLQDRLSKMIGGVCIINVGGNNEVEMKEKKDRVDDALAATRAAVEEGIVPGGGVALLRARLSLNELEKINSNQALGVKLIFDACGKPFRQILENAGYSEEQSFEKMYELTSKKDKWKCFNPLTSKYSDAFNEGILDPTKVTISCLKHASSTAISILLTEGIISKVKEEKKENFDMSNLSM